MKTCKQCGIEKQSNQFLQDRRIKDGLCKLCIACMAEAKGYTQDQYQYLMLTGHLRGFPGYYANHTEERLAYTKEWHKLHPESVKQITAKYHKENPEVHREASSRRRARLAGAEINDFVEEDWEWLKEAYNYCCAYCGKTSDNLDKDHVIPLSKGGDHTISNIVPSCHSCNLHKSARTPTEADMRFALYVNIEYD